MTEFDRFVAVDWSGAKGLRQKGIAVASCGSGRGTPMLVTAPDGRAWSRQGVMDWLNREATGKRLLAGFDFSFGAPFEDEEAFFPGASLTAKDAPSLWLEIENICRDEPHLGASGLPQHGEFSRFFQSQEGEITIRGAEFAPRLRVTERLCHDQGLGKAETLFNLIGARQVGKASLTGMRALLRLEGFDIWPFDEPSPGRSCAIEIFTRICLIMAGAGHKKLRDAESLDRALKALECEPSGLRGKLDDHATDAMVSAAALRVMAGRSKYWQPAALSDRVRRTEGWTFGVL
ncbi:MAG: hypothetical protein V3R73_07675 [Sphingomonadales bacterium]